MSKKLVLGFNGPVVENMAGFSDENFIRISPRKDCFSSIRFLKSIFSEIYVVILAGNKIKPRVQQWLDVHDFCHSTGIVSEKRINIMPTEVDYASVFYEINPDMAIDSRPEVLEPVRCRLILFDPKLTQTAFFATKMHMFETVQHWKEITDRFPRPKPNSITDLKARLSYR